MTSRRWDDEDRLMTELGDALKDPGPVDPKLLEAGRGAFAWRTVDEDLTLAALAYDSLLDDGLVVRSGAQTATRALIFTGGESSVEIQVTEHGIIGQLIPEGVGEVTLVSADGAVAHATADEIGCFLLPSPPSGPVRLRCRTGEAGLVTDWFTR